jgi:hypothetical protein
MKNIIYLLLSFLIVFLLGISSLKAEICEVCEVYYNAKTNTKIAYKCSDKVDIIPGNTDVCVIAKGIPVPLVPFYVVTLQKDNTISLPSLIEIKSIHESEFKNNRYVYLEKKETKKLSQEAEK